MSTLTTEEHAPVDSRIGNDQPTSVKEAAGDRWRPNPDIVAKRLGETIVLLNLRDDRFYELNSTAARLWELVTSGLNRREVTEQILAEFNVDPAQFGAECDEMLASMEKKGLVEIDE